MHGHAYRVAAQGAGRSADRSLTTALHRRIRRHVAALCTGGLPRPLRARASSGRLHLQDSRVAGSRYYDCHAVLDRLRPGDSLQLRRQPDNPHDPRAIEVLWREHKLGYLPRLDNAAAASLIDRSYVLRAEIIGVDDPKEEWEPVRLRVWADFNEIEQRT